MNDLERNLLMAIARALAAFIENTPVLPECNTMGAEYDELIRATVAMTGKS